MSTPNHWRPVVLGDILTRIEAGKSFTGEPRQATPDEWGIIKVSAMTYGTFRESENKAVAPGKEFAPSCEIQPGDLLLSRANTRDYVGASVLVGNCRPQLLLSDKSLRLHPIDAVDRRWLWYVLNAPTSRRWMSDASSGVKSGMRNISQGALRALPLTLPPLHDQQRIVRKLDDHLSHLDAARRQLSVAIRRAEAWRRAIIDRAIRQDAEPWLPIGDLLREPMRNGLSAPAVGNDEPGIRTLTLTAVTRGIFSDAFTKVTSADPRKAESLWLTSGDILVQRANTPELVGTTALYQGPDRWAIFPDLLIRLRVRPDVVVAGYLAAVMRSERIHRTLRAKAKGLAGSMPKIDQAAIASTIVPVPPIERQLDVVERLNEVEEADTRLMAALATAQRRESLLRRSLLEAAFSGKLTGRPNDMYIVEEIAGV